MEARRGKGDGGLLGRRKLAFWRELEGRKMGKLEGRRELEARREWGAGGREGKRMKLKVRGALD